MLPASNEDFSWTADTLSSSHDTSRLLSGVEFVEEGLRSQNKSPVKEEEPVGGPGGVLGTFLACVSIDRLKHYFNVNDQEVMERALYSILVKQGKFPPLTGESEPDFYGPLWFSTTLVFFAAIGSTLELIGAGEVVDYRVIVESFMIVYGYLGLGTLAFWGASVYFALGVGLTQALCLYGYSMSIFIPAALLSGAQSAAWVSLLLAGTISGAFLGQNTHVIAKEKAPGKEILILGAQGVLHFLFVLVLKFSLF